MLELNHIRKNKNPTPGKTDQILALSLRSRSEVCHWLPVFTVFGWSPLWICFPMFLRICFPKFLRICFPKEMFFFCSCSLQCTCQGQLGGGEESKRPVLQPKESTSCPLALSEAKQVLRLIFKSKWVGQTALLEPPWTILISSNRLAVWKQGFTAQNRVKKFVLSTTALF